MVSSVVAPCIPSRPHVRSLMCMAHQMPTYFPGFTHDTSPSLLGSFRFRITFELTSPTASGAICIVRQGLTKGTAVFTSTPSDHGRNAALNLPVSSCSNVMPE